MRVRLDQEELTSKELKEEIKRYSIKTEEKIEQMNILIQAMSEKLKKEEEKKVETLEISMKR
jgi:hypothetical protein